MAQKKKLNAKQYHQILTPERTYLYLLKWTKSSVFFFLAFLRRIKIPIFFLLQNSAIDGIYQNSYKSNNKIAPYKLIIEPLFFFFFFFGPLVCVKKKNWKLPLSYRVFISFPCLGNLVLYSIYLIYLLSSLTEAYGLKAHFAFSLHPSSKSWDGDSNWQNVSPKLFLLKPYFFFPLLSLLHIPRARFPGCRAIGSAHGRINGVWGRVKGTGCRAAMGPSKIIWHPPHHRYRHHRSKYRRRFFFLLVRWNLDVAW